MKRSQIKFGESIGIILIVYIVVVLGFVWYNDVNSNALQELYEKDQRNLAFEKYYFIVNLDLLHVSQRGLVDEAFDETSFYAMQEFANTDEGKAFLSDRLGDASISVSIRSLDNVRDELDVIVLYNQTPTREVETLETFRTLIPVVDDSEQKIQLGILEVTVPITART